MLPDRGANIGVVEQYLPIVLFAGRWCPASPGVGSGSRLLGPKRPTGAKEGPYESGIAPRYQPAARFPVRFYLVAMIFIIFDIEVIFLYPWAVMYRQLWTFGLAEMATFAVVVFIAFAYLVSNGALDWGPRRRRGGRRRPISLDHFHDPAGCAGRASSPKHRARSRSMAKPTSRELPEPSRAHTGRRAATTRLAAAECGSLPVGTPVPDRPTVRSGRR